MRFCTVVLYSLCNRSISRAESSGEILQAALGPLQGASDGAVVGSFAVLVAPAVDPREDEGAGLADGEGPLGGPVPFFQLAFLRAFRYNGVAGGIIGDPEHVDNSVFIVRVIRTGIPVENSGAFHAVIFHDVVVAAVVFQDGYFFNFSI